MKHLKNEKGAALVIVIIVLAIVSILGIAMMFSVTSEVKLNRAIEDTAVVKYLAQAGIDNALYLIENDNGTMTYPYNKEVVLGDRTRVYTMNITKSANVIIISSIGKVEKNGVIKHQMTLQATIDEKGKVVVK